MNTYYKLTNSEGHRVPTKQLVTFGIQAPLTMHSTPIKNDTKIKSLELCLLTGHLIRRWKWLDEQWQEESVSYGIYESIIS